MATRCTWSRAMNWPIWAPSLLSGLVKGDEHQRPALVHETGGGLDQQVLLAALLVGALLHGVHAEFIGPGRAAVGGVGDGDRGGVPGLRFGHGFRRSDRLGW